MEALSNDIRTIKGALLWAGLIAGRLSPDGERLVIENHSWRLQRVVAYLQSSPFGRQAAVGETIRKA